MKQAQSELKSNAEWKQWGKEDPLWAVASWQNKQKGGASPWTEEEFYSLGASDWSDFSRRWQQYGLNTHSCLEIGCGAGRMTKQLASSFEHVYAVDVSDEMIRCAQKAIVAANVEFSVIDGLDLPQKDNSVTAVFSTHVMQHLDNIQVGFSYFKELYRVLEKGGTLMIHLPLYQFPAEAGVFGFFLRTVYSVERRLARLKADAMRLLRVKTMRGTPYPMESLRNELSGLGFSDVEYRVFNTTNSNAPHPFVFARKS